MADSIPNREQKQKFSEISSLTSWEKEVQGHTDINWETLYPVRHNLNHLAQPITEEEICMVINEWPSNRPQDRRAYGIILQSL